MPAFLGWAVTRDSHYFSVLFLSRRTEEKEFVEDRVKRWEERERESSAKEGNTKKEMESAERASREIEFLFLSNDERG